MGDDEFVRNRENIVLHNLKTPDSFLYVCSRELNLNSTFKKILKLLLAPRLFVFMLNSTEHEISTAPKTKQVTN